MSVQTLKLGGREFVVLPKSEYDRLTAKSPKPSRRSAQEKGDLAEANRRLQSLARGRSKAISLRDLKAELGL